jgi:hypothetical protein
MADSDSGAKPTPAGSDQGANDSTDASSNDRDPNSQQNSQELARQRA